MKYQVLFSLKQKEKYFMSSAAVVICALRVNSRLGQPCGPAGFYLLQQTLRTVDQFYRSW